LGSPSKRNIIACCTQMPRWQNRCYRASRKFCSNYLLMKSFKV